MPATPSMRFRQSARRSWDFSNGRNSSSILTIALSSLRWLNQIVVLQNDVSRAYWQNPGDTADLFTEYSVAEGCAAELAAFH
jgi:hypothetical protein